MRFRRWLVDLAFKYAEKEIRIRMIAKGWATREEVRLALAQYGVYIAETEDGLGPLQTAKKRAVLQCLEKNKWNQAKSARELQIRPNTLIIYMRKWGIVNPRFARKIDPTKGA